MENDITQQKNLTTKEIFGYSFYSVASMLGMITFMFLNMFWPERGFSMVLFSTALLISRIADFFITLFVGPIMEKVKLKVGGGRYRPWLFVFQFIIYIGMVVLFFDPGNDMIRFIIVLVGNTIVNASMSFIMVACFGILPQMAGASAVDRNRLTAWNYRFMTAGSVLTSFGGAYILTWFGIVIPAPWNYLVMTAVFGAFYFLGIAVLRATAKPYDIVVEAAPGMSMPSISLKDMAKAVATNSQLLILLLAQTIMFTGMMAMMNIMIFYWRLIVPFTHTGVGLNDAFPGLYTIGNTITTIMSFIFSLVGPPLGMRLGGKARAMALGCLAAAISGVLNFFFGAGMWALYVAISMLGTFGAAVYSGFGINYALDCGEYGLWKTGQDNRLVIMSMTNMPMKIAAILGGFILYAMAAIGYDAEAANLAIYVVGELPAFVTDSFVTGFMALLALVPAACNLIAAALMAFAYKIKDDDAARYAKENMEKMMAGGGMGMPPMGPPPEEAPAA